MIIDIWLIHRNRRTEGHCSCSSTGSGGNISAATGECWCSSTGTFVSFATRSALTGHLQSWWMRFKPLKVLRQNHCKTLLMLRGLLKVQSVFASAVKVALPPISDPEDRIGGNHEGWEAETLVTSGAMITTSISVASAILSESGSG